MKGVETQAIEDARALDELVARVAEEPRYVLDTEFHGERSYWPRLALIQIAWSDGIALVDPLAVDASRLTPLLESPAVLVAHAAEQDLAILDRLCGRGPTELFDTQVAAGFLGLGSPSLVALVERLLGVRLGKGDRLTDWTRRPLRPEQRTYAAADVEHLLGLQDALVVRLEEMGRAEWARDECEDRRQRIRTRPEPDVAWWRIKGARQLRGRSRGVAQAVAAWRERTAEQLDVPPRYVLSDLALAGIVQRPPRSREDLAGVRGVDNRFTKDGSADALLGAVQEGLDLPAPELRLPEPDRIDRSLAPAVTVLGAWLAQRARARPRPRGARDACRPHPSPPGRLEPARAAGGATELVGAPLQRLLAGHATLALADGGRRIQLCDADRAVDGNI